MLICLALDVIRAEEINDYESRSFWPRLHQAFQREEIHVASTNPRHIPSTDEQRIVAYYGQGFQSWSQLLLPRISAVLGLPQNNEDYLDDFLIDFLARLFHEGKAEDLD
ncbi:uncharacterized protein N7483_002409 [Penicillium malachiteum]|uniref:uncharacterized protein n=1 Tax=Penicillium malachiteum TaxID=1324776 RepID=UPI002546F1FF|nr:uncharacterized protein N7483_002409 [Penicillium malachiteum]KAJ5737284.1 hypothetical protein N7483_002409 [Penicillium malachiteum]